MAESYPDFFFRVTGRRPLPYQERYGANPFSHTLLIAPTGLGKTDATLMPYLYARAIGDSSAPRRLIIVLPRQNLTTQTAGCVRKRVETSGLKDSVKVLELLAGSGDNDETLCPNDAAVIVATQDLYFSRALNRGYARRPPRWPLDFALYNQDCLIVLDEIQLMDDALATSTQLAAFRERFGIYGRAPCVWMSATVNPDWLSTVDFHQNPVRIGLDDRDRSEELVRKRIHATKRIAHAPESCRTAAGCAEFVVQRHRAGTRSLVIANTVARAREVFSAVRKKFPNAVLLHSRFRPGDRKRASTELDAALAGEGQIVVATQVLEAGIDITSRLLVSDAAPWGSMVQRFGRVNRYGDDTDAEIYWVVQPTHSKQKDPSSTAPYSPADVSASITRLSGLRSAAPADLPPEDGPASYEHVLRRADLLDLFDTTPDLSGNELDVSRFIRATEDKDVYLAWRNWGGEGAPSSEIPELTDDELCPVPLGEFREFTRKHSVYSLNFATEEWVEIGWETPVYPGMRAVTRSVEGGYTAAEGWSPESKTPVTPAEPAGDPDTVETDTSDRRSFPKYRQTLRSHTDRVVSKMTALLAGSEVDGPEAGALLEAARKHDWGKAHPVFQATMHRNDSSDELLAKQCGRAKHDRAHFRHELASGLAMLQAGDSDLAAYLAAAHHGRVRLNIRSMPGEREGARGIRDGDRLPACKIGSGVEAPEMSLSLDLMKSGAPGGSWTERALRLRDRYGPFRLAYLEALVRAADELASADHGEEIQECP